MMRMLLSTGLREFLFVPFLILFLNQDTLSWVLVVLRGKTGL